MTPDRHDFDAAKRLLIEVPTTPINLQLNVRQRLEHLHIWETTWKAADRYLLERIDQLDGQQGLDAQRAVGIDIVRERLEWQRLKSPLEIAVSDVEMIGFAHLRAHLVQQFVTLTQAEKLQWLTNFMFVMTPELREVTKKIATLLDWTTFGQRRCMLLGGHSGMGKTTYLHWLSSHALGHVQAERNWIPFLLVDAPRSNLSAKTLPKRMIQACGMTAFPRGDEEVLLQQLTLYLRQCGTVLAAIDEIEHVKQPALRRRVLDISNHIRMPFICSSVNPRQWAYGDLEVEGRWNDYHALKPYKGERLGQLLAFIDLVLPFPETSQLITKPIMTLIERWTGGILRDIMAVMVDASKLAIQQNLPRVSVEVLQAAWASLQRQQVRDFGEEDGTAY